MSGRDKEKPALRAAMLLSAEACAVAACGPMGGARRTPAVLRTESCRPADGERASTAAGSRVSERCLMAFGTLS